MRACGKDPPEDNWLDTVNQFNNSLLVKIHPDRVPFLTARGDHYATFVNNNIGLAMMELENFTIQYLGLDSN